MKARLSSQNASENFDKNRHFERYERFIHTGESGENVWKLRYMTT